MSKASITKWMVGIAAAVGIALSACTPLEQQIFQQIPDEAKPAVFAQWASSQHSATDCYGEMRKHWPAHLHGWAEGIIHRESRGNARAQNGKTSAAGCFQLMHSYHHWRYPADCRDRYNAHCNVQAAWHLYQDDPRAWRFSA